MLALKITETKDFMNRLLAGDTFDRFLVAEAAVTTCNTFLIDGRVHSEFFTEEEKETGQAPPFHLSEWEALKPVCYSLIRGKKTPLSFKFIFHLSPRNTERFLAQSGLPYSAADILGLVLTVRFDGACVLCTTGTSLEIFTMDKSLDHAWDQMVRRFFLKSQISFEEC